MYGRVLLFLALVALLFFLSAFFSVAETALMSMSRLRIRYLAKRGDAKARLIKYFVGKPDKLLGTILIADNFIDVIAGSLTAYFIATAVGGHNGLYDLVASFFVAMALVTFGKILPKTIAISNPEQLSLRVIYPMRVLIFLLNPIVRVVTFFSNSFARWLGFRFDTEASSRVLTEDEIRSIIGEQPQGLSKGRRELLYNVFKLGDTRVQEVMIPRTEVTAVDINSPPEEVLKTIHSSGYSRVPVYRNHFDNIIGILYSKDLLSLFSKESSLEGVSSLDLEKALHTAHFIPDMAKIETVLRQLQRSRVHMAIVVDEFGGVEGIVTIEDILEEIVGEIRDEYDLEQEPFRKISPDTYVIEGAMTVKEFNNQLGLHIPETSHYTTIAGFLITLIGRLLKEGDKIKFENITFDVEKVKGHRASLIRVRIAQPLAPTLQKKA